MTFPTPYEVGWHTATTVQTGRGSTTTYTPAKDQTGTARKVYGFWPTRQAETSEVRVESDLDLGVPPGFGTVNPGDVVDIPLDKSIGQFEVVAYAEDWNFGPFKWQPGSVVKLKRVES